MNIRHLFKKRIPVTASEVILEPTPEPAYPRWKHLIPEEITPEMVEKAFVKIFGFPSSECLIRWDGETFVVRHPTTFCYHGGFGSHTDTPNIKGSFQYNGGCSWAVDLDGNRYYKIENGLPKDWERVQAGEIMSRYLAQNDRFIEWNPKILTKEGKKP